LNVAASGLRETVFVSSSPARSGADDWAGRKVLITGGTGFIGSRLVGRLNELGAKTHLVSRRPDPAVPSSVVSSTVDLTDPTACVALMRAHQPEVVFHLASEVSGVREVDRVVPMMQANLGIAVHLLAAVAQEVPHARIVLAGSIEETLHEARLAPTSPYAAAKGAATSYATMFAFLWGLPVSVLRIGMVYGPGQSDRSKLIPSVTTALLRGDSPPVSSGKRLVDWVFIDDVVDAFLCAAQAMTPPGAVVDVCTGRPTSIREALEKLAKIVGGPGVPRFGALPDRIADVAKIGDPGPAAELIGWRPTTSLDEGLRRTVAWYDANRPVVAR
jgi:nucleoside-diphosphate-sugar epimerase